MGIDFEIVAYRGTPASIERLAKLIARYTPYAELFRHAIASEVESPVARDLHMIAFYDDQRGDAGDETDAADADSGARPARTGVFMPESMLAAVRESAANGGSLADAVKQAWSLARAIHATPPGPAGAAEAECETETSCSELARELSRGGEAFLLGYGDHSCVGIYDKIVARYFPDTSSPPLCRVESPERPLPFDPDRYSIGISETM